MMTTQRLILRPWTEEDAPALYKYAQDPRVGPIAGWPAHQSEAESLAVIQGPLSERETYALVLKQTLEPVGCISIRLGGACTAPAGDDEGELGYWLGVPYWGRGLVPEAVNRMLERCFLELNLRGVWCGYYEGNHKSRRVQDKCGFTYHHQQSVKPPHMDDVRLEHFTYLARSDWAGGS